jgi:hypothetical protein
MLKADQYAVAWAGLTIGKYYLGSFWLVLITA